MAWRIDTAGVKGPIATGVIWFYLVENFVVSRWGDAKNVAFKHRLMIETGKDR